MTTEQLARCVKTKRERMNLTQMEFSKKLGLTQAQLSSLENGKHPPRFDKLISIADKLGYRIVMVRK